MTKTTVPIIIQVRNAIENGDADALDAVLTKPEVQDSHLHNAFLWLQWCARKDDLQCAQVLVDRAFSHPSSFWTTKLSVFSPEMCVKQFINCLNETYTTPMMRMVEEIFSSSGLLPEIKQWIALVSGAVNDKRCVEHFVSQVQNDQELLQEVLIHTVQFNMQADIATVLVPYMDVEAWDDAYRDRLFVEAADNHVQGLMDLVYTLDRAERMMAEHPHIYWHALALEERMAADRLNRNLTHETAHLGLDPLKKRHM